MSTAGSHRPPVSREVDRRIAAVRPIVEIMTVNFSPLALDQIVNNAATLSHMVRCADARGSHADTILPTMDDWTVAAHVAAATGLQAQAEGIARLSLCGEDLYAVAIDKIQNARRATSLLMDNELIAPPPA